jgi:RNA polymerase sigma-70 factor (ECF subfamily)
LDEQRINEGIVSAAIKGDREALSLLWDDSRRWVAAIILAHKPREADLEDLLQQVAMQLCRKINTLDEPRAFRGWLRTMAINIARAEGRKTTRRKRSMLRLVGLEPSPDRTRDLADELVQASEESKRVYHAARSLPSGYREPVLLRCLQSMSYEQIGDAMGLPVTTIETRIARGRRMLREILAQQKRQEETQRRATLQGSAIGGAP